MATKWRMNAKSERKREEGSGREKERSCDKKCTRGEERGGQEKSEESKGNGNGGRRGEVKRMN
eukprot:602499-Hanusia_phi.AAC.2